MLSTISFFVLSKKFPIIQNNLNSAIIHNFQMNIDDSWSLLYPYIKTAYKNNEIDNVIFQNYDFYRYLKDGYQEFNSYKIEQIPFDFRKDQDIIPLKNVDFFNEFKKVEVDLHIDISKDSFICYGLTDTSLVNLAPKYHILTADNRLLGELFKSCAKNILPYEIMKQFIH